MWQAISKTFNAGPGGLKIDPRLPLVGLAGVAALVALAVVVWLWRDQGALRPLYGSGQAFPASQVMEVLDGENIPYRLHPQSGQVLVHEQDLSRARLTLAARGVQVAVPAGYDLFDREEPLGTSQFVQDVRLKRSLEGELARTIMAIDGVEGARVHLALGKSTSFVVAPVQPAKASVMVQLKAGASLSAEQTGAIVNLVAGSVPGLAAGDVSVVDQYGSLLTQGLDPGQGGAPAWRVVQDYQRQAVGNVEAVLGPLFGPGNVRVSVAADMDFSQREETHQQYGEAPRLRSERLQDESVLDQLALGVPGSLSNRPAAAPAPAQAGAESSAQAATSLRKESNRQMDYDQSVTHVKHAPFQLRQQSVAVLVNGQPDAEAWTPAARERLLALVKSAVGFNEARGDALTLDLFPFIELAEPVQSSAWWQESWFYGLMRLALIGLISVLVLLWMVRPVIRKLAEPREPVSAADPVATALQGPTSLPGGLAQDDPLAEISLPAPGSGVELQLEHLQLLADRDPERVSEVLKQWIGRHDSPNP
ncbi:flagellar basal-body MS-ring/collar protein FliF [Pseudomonas sp. HR96]|uniref:flagellar basal-body MS-ring/collar protein FliF n=1 Tax=Pseudomonas sp. HR96 TaxID=1027966 RepID=UPI002A74E891|nr:flagellar basal-body MS-ring/collar protein FliF [Pseudomonas sp. HR96]WPP00049.1 flagellar basal-body MS-ring/collar protein FliF [Pseudomonas sp. HR96]